MVRIMRIFRPWPWLALLALAGCCHRNSSCREDLSANLPHVARLVPPFDWKCVPGTQDWHRTVFIGPYRALTEQEAQCLAVHNSQGASMLEQEGGLGSKCPKSKADMEEALTSFSGLEAMNKDAATALNAYFRLAKSEAQRDLLDLSLAEANRAVEHIEVMKKKGVKEPAEFEEFRKKLNLIQADHVLLDEGIEKLNRLLGKMIDLKGVPEHQRILPVAELCVSPVPVDEEAAVSLGLGTRPELRLLRYAREELRRGNISVIRELLKSTMTLLGKSPSGPLGKLKTFIAAREISTRRDQLDSAIRQMERDVNNEVREAIGEMRAHAYLAAVVRKRVEDAQQRLQDLESKLEKGLVSPLEVSNARQVDLKARADLIQEAAAWNIARTKLKGAQGILPLECGRDYQPIYRHQLCREIRERLHGKDDCSCGNAPVSEEPGSPMSVPIEEHPGMPRPGPVAVPSGNGMLGEPSAAPPRIQFTR